MRHRVGRKTVAYSQMEKGGRGGTKASHSRGPREADDLIRWLAGR